MEFILKIFCPTRTFTNFRVIYYFAANSHENVTECLRRLLNNSEVKSIVSEANSEGGEESVVNCYLHDFTHMVYKPNVEGELEVKVERTLRSVKLTCFILCLQIALLLFKMKNELQNNEAI